MKGRMKRKSKDMMRKTKRLFFIIAMSMMSMSLYAAIIYNGQAYTETNMPYSYNGTTEAFIVVSGTIDNFSSNRMSIFEINGVDMNITSSLPAPVDGKKYFIRLKGRNKNASASITGTNDWTQASLTVSPTSLSSFSYISGDGPSSVNTFTVSGQGLTANISLSAPANYDISTSSGSGFGSSLTLAQSNGTVALTTIYVRLRSGLSVGSYNAETITISSTGLSDETVSLNGDVLPIPDPSLTLTPTSLSGFIAQPGTPSLEQSFTISGQNLTSDINLSAPTNYEISETSGSGFVSSINLTQSNGTVPTTTIYTRLKSGLPAGIYNNENITISTSGSSDQTVTLSGDVIADPDPSLTVSPTSLSGFSYMSGNGPSSEFAFTLGGQALTSDISVSAPSHYEISTTSGSGFASSLILTQSDGIVSSTSIYVRLRSSLSIGSYDNESITISTSGTDNESVTLIGEVLAIPDPSMIVSVSSLSGFIAQTDTPSPEQIFTVSGQNLISDISLSAPMNYDISTTSGNGFGQSITLTPSAGTVTPTTIYVRLKSDLLAGTYNGENIIIGTSGANDQTVSLSGEVQQSTVINWNGNDYTFVEMPYSYSGGNVTRIYTYGKITSFSTNNKINSLVINGQTFATNQTITTPPASIDQKFFITITPKNSQGNFELNGETREIEYELNIKVLLEGAKASDK
jgi:hypothetical protein